jgi:heptosyltransferase-3
MKFLKKSKNIFSPKNILIIATRQIGDTLITSPLITKTHETWPHAKIDFLGFTESINILNGHPLISEIIGTSKHPNKSEYWYLIKRLFKRYDLALITQPSDRAHLFGLLSAKSRHGVVDKNIKNSWWKRLTCRHTVEIDYFNQHVVTEKLKLIPSNQNSHHHSIKIIPPMAEPLPFGLHIKKPFIVIHPSPLGAYKKIPNTTWQKIINNLARDFEIYLTGSKCLRDKKLNQAIISSIIKDKQNKIHDLSGQLNFSQTVTLLQKASLYIGIDTSISHLAAACETRCIILFGPTPPTNFGPWPNNFKSEQPYILKSPKQVHDNITILQGPGECVPCRKAGCDDSNGISKCLYELSAESILNVVYEVLENQFVTK